MLKRYNYFDFASSLQAFVFVLFTIHQGTDGPSELNMVFLLKRKSSKETSELSDIVAFDRKKSIKGIVKRDLKSSKQNHSLANCVLFQLFRALVLLATVG